MQAPEPGPALRAITVESGAGPVFDTVWRTIDIEQQGLAALKQALREGLADSISNAIGLLAAVSGNIIVTGMGKSGHVARKVAATFASTGTPSHFVHPAEASHGDLGMIGPGDAVLAISWSGETPELADIVAYTRRFRIPLIAVTSRPQSALATAADVSLILPVAREACPNGLAPTTSTTMQMALGDSLAIALLERRGFTARDFHRFHPGGKLGAKLLKVGKLMHTGEELPLIPLEATLAEGIVEMTSKRFGIAGVTNETGELVGVLTDGDLRRSFQNGFVDRPVAEAMGRNPRTVGPDSLAEQVLAQMNQSKITCVFVVEKNKPVGLIHIHDLLRSGVV